MESEFLYRYFSGELSESEMEKIMLWAKSSDENRHRLIRERKTYDLLTLQENDMLRQKLEVRRLPARSLLSLRPLMRIAAMVAVVLAASWGAIRISDAFRTYPEQTVYVPAGQRIDIILSDGSKVCLNGRSSLTYPTVFNKKVRNVTLNGQAYFEVVSGKSAPFVVTTSKGEVEVMGTKFDVLDFADEPVFETALMEGKVKVALQSAPDESFVIAPNMKIFLRDGKLVREYIEDNSSYLWRSGLIAFREASFGKIMSELQKNYDIRIQVENDKLQQISYTGKFRMADGIDYALKVLQRDVNFTYTRSEDHKTIFIK